MTLSAVFRSLSVAASLAFLTACPANSPESNRPPAAQKWFERAIEAYKVADVDEAHDSAAKALALIPQDPEVRTLAATVALARLDYAETLRLLKDVKTTDAAGLRGRALWYKGDLDGAADELEAMLNDPSVKDEWAKSISKLARQGSGRQPFAITGGLLANMQIVRVSANAPPYFIVPVEIDGEAALALVATGVPEVMIDSATRPDPSWVSLRFGGKVEVHDVPALSQDLSGFSRDLGAPVKALLGVNLLRHLNITADYRGEQFVVRSFTPPPPPAATRIDLYYVKGGKMLVRGALGAGKQGVRASLLVDSSQPSALALDQDGWKKAGVELASLQIAKDDPSGKMKFGVVPSMRLGAFDIAQVPAEFGVVNFTDLSEKMGGSNAWSKVDVDGVIGASLLAPYRITFGDEGRLLWMEDDSAVERVLNGGISTPQGMPNGGVTLPPPPGPGLGPALAPTGIGPILPLPINEIDRPLDKKTPPPPAPKGKKPGAKGGQ